MSWTSAPRITHLPLIDLPQQLGCGDVPLWDRWLAHPDARRVLARARRHDRTSRRCARRCCRSPAGTTTRAARSTTPTRSTAVPGHPFIRLVMGPGAHKGVDYVAGDFGPQSRVDTRRLQLRWFDHYLLGKDNGVDRGAAVRRLRLRRQHVAEGSRVAARARRADEVVLRRRAAAANTSAGDGMLDTLPPTGAAGRHVHLRSGESRRRILIDSRELETSLNEDFATLNATRHDALVFTSPAAHAADRGDGPDDGHALGRDRRRRTRTGT